MSKKNETETAVIPQQISSEGVVTEFSKLVSSAVTVDGGELLETEDWPLLKKVPLMIVGATYRKSDIADPNQPEGAAYVSLEIMIADETWLRRRRVNLDTFQFTPGERLIINDNSTGIRRQFTEYLHLQNYIKVAENAVSGGKRGESSFDSAPGTWAEITEGEITFDADGFGTYTIDLTRGGLSPLFCVRGIRDSEYENEFTKEGVTWYIA